MGALPTSPVAVVLVLALLGEDAVGESGIEGSVLYDVMEHHGEIKAFGGKFTLLASLEEVLDAEVNNIEDLCGEEAVLTGQVNVGGNVGLDVPLELPELSNLEA